VTANLPPVMNSAEVARFFGVSTRTLKAWALAGKIPYFKTLGGHRRYKREDVLAVAEKANNADL
jgi:excisionase family DNA binding protein